MGQPEQLCRVPPAHLQLALTEDTDGPSRSGDSSAILFSGLLSQRCVVTDRFGRTRGQPDVVHESRRPSILDKQSQRLSQPATRFVNRPSLSVAAAKAAH